MLVFEKINKINNVLVMLIQGKREKGKRNNVKNKNEQYWRYSRDFKNNKRLFEKLKDRY